MRYFYAFFVFLVLATLSIAGFRGSKSHRPPIEIFPDMDRQAKLHPQGASSFWADGMADRPVIANTVPAGSFTGDVYLLTGKTSGGEWGRGFPESLTVDADLMKRGQERYAIYCELCHGATGDGNTIFKQFALPVSSYHDPRLREMAEGEIFNTITNGKNNMGPYASKVTPEDRWAIILYLRALQRAQNASPEDLSETKRKELGL